MGGADRASAIVAGGSRRVGGDASDLDAGSVSFDDNRFEAARPSGTGDAVVAEEARLSPILVSIFFADSSEKRVAT